MRYILSVLLFVGIASPAFAQELDRLCVNYDVIKRECRTWTAATDPKRARGGLSRTVAPRDLPEAHDKPK